MECELPFSFDEGIAEYERYCDAAAHIDMEEHCTPETHAVSALADLGQPSSTETSPFSATTPASPVSQSMAHANDSSSPPVRVRKRLRGKTTSAAYDPLHNTEIKNAELTYSITQHQYKPLSRANYSAVRDALRHHYFVSNYAKIDDASLNASYALRRLQSNAAYAKLTKLEQSSCSMTR